MRFLPFSLRMIRSNRSLFMMVLASLAALLVLLLPLVYFVVRYGVSLQYLLRLLAALVFVVVFGHGFARGFLYHPVFDEPYRRWLERTPWNPSLPLPKGPLHLVWSDLFILTGLAVIEYLLLFSVAPLGWWPVLGIFILFALVIAIVWSRANAATGQDAHLTATVALPVLFGIMQVPLAGYALCPFLMAGIAWHGVRRSLDSFPWSDRDVNAYTVRSSHPKARVLGWPFRDLLQPYKEFRTSKLRASVEAALAGGWMWCLLSPLLSRESLNVHDVDKGLGRILITPFLVACVLALLRLVAYAPVLSRNLCLGNRISNRRWIIPHHDQIFLAPLLIIVTGWAAPQILFHWLGASIAVSCGITVSAIVLIARAMGPSISELQFTGVHSRTRQSLADRTETREQAIRTSDSRDSLRPAK